MSNTNESDWEPFSDTVQHDQRSAYDEMREQCPVACSESRGWSVFRHADIMDILHDPETFSNNVSSHTSVPNGMDPPEHTAYRRFIEQFFSDDQLAKFEPPCRQIASNLVDQITGSDEVEIINTFARPFSVQIQCAFMGWSEDMHEPLREWTQKNIKAIRRQDRSRIKEVAEIFKDKMTTLLDEKLSEYSNGNEDVTTHLLEQTVEGRPLTDEEIISILRNWTMGEVGTITNAIGIIVHFVAVHNKIQERLRGGDLDIKKAIEEILRLHGPLVTNRRKTTCPVEIENQEIGSGEIISINWVAANRDQWAFNDPETFLPDRNQDLNLLYGAGIHACPAAPLARMELRIVLEELLSRTSTIALLQGRPPVKAQYPESGYNRLYVQLY